MILQFITSKANNQTSAPSPAGIQHLLYKSTDQQEPAPLGFRELRSI